MTGTALALYTPQEQVALGAEIWPLANRLCETEFVPVALRKRPEAVLACMLKGTELGLPLMQSLSAIHVIEGRPTMSAELMRAVVQSRGHQIVVEESTSARCIIKGCRIGQTEWQRFTFSRDDAERAGVLHKDAWKKWPQSMMLARASSLLCRAVFADCLAGISYTIEELNDGVDELPPVEVVETVEPKASRRTASRTSRARKRQSSEPPPAAPALRPVPPLPDEAMPAAEPATVVDVDVPRPGAQAIAIALRPHGVTTSEDRARACSQILGRPVTSRQLTPADIAIVLGVVGALDRGVPFPFIDGPAAPPPEEHEEPPLPFEPEPQGEPE